MKLQRESSLVKNDAGILRSISNVKDVEANAERESGRESGQILKLESRFRLFREIWPNGTNRSC
jgi:hypothetical protein